MTICTKCGARINRQFTSRHRSGRIFTRCENGHIATYLELPPEPVEISDPDAAWFDDDDDIEDTAAWSMGVGAP